MILADREPSNGGSSVNLIISWGASSSKRSAQGRSRCRARRSGLAAAVDESSENGAGVSASSSDRAGFRRERSAHQPSGGGTARVNQATLGKWHRRFVPNASMASSTSPVPVSHARSSTTRWRDRGEEPGGDCATALIRRSGLWSIRRGVSPHTAGRFGGRSGSSRT